MSKKVVSTPSAPAAVGPYSQAIVSNGLVFCSGQVPLDPATGELVGGTIADQTRRCMENLAAVLEAAGSGFANVVKVTVFLTDMDDFAELNEAYGEFFGDEPPARATFAVAALPKGAQVEIECVAHT
ncbi:MAG: RidA family protein, partial [Actinomycetota bacterium]|nr:RidA family protein [Actinomycetota bacterium]